MKHVYLMVAALFTATISNAQIFDEHFEDDIPAQFLDQSQFTAGQSGSDLVITSAGHDEFVSVNYTLNDGVDADPISFSATDSIFVRARADFESDIRPVLNFGLIDGNGVSPNNLTFNANSALTLSSEWQVFGFVVGDFTMEFGAGDDPNLGMVADGSNVATLTFGTNTGFAGAFPITNADGIAVTEAFVGTLFIDFVSVGERLDAGEELEVFTAYDHAFTAESLEEVTAAGSFITAIVNDGLEIITAGHDEFEIVNVPVTGGVVDITENTNVFFTVTATPDMAFSGPVGVTIALVDEVGTRIDADAVMNVVSAANETTVVYEITNFNNLGTGVMGNAGRIASFDILINQGFAQTFAFVNDLGETVNEAFQGTIRVSEIKIGEAVIDGVFSSVESLDLNTFPNPVVNTLFISNDELNEGSYMISNNQGIVVSEGTVNGNGIAVDGLSTGAYIITVTSDEGTLYTSQFIK